ncbi:NAD(P)-binding protein [Gautieria morchelliformis]|nr:NAD(P)-binding protein [Gautieria morchelliformis]
MAAVPDSELHTDAHRVKGKVVLITGAASGIGRSAALHFAKHGAKVVIGDLDLKGAEEVVAEIKCLGSDAVAQICDVTSWEQQLALFQFAMSTYSRIDIVVPNAGVTELGRLTAVRATAVNGVPTKPNLKTLEVNLTGVVYSTRLALFYLLEKDSQALNSLKAIVFIGSMASIQSIPVAPLYSTSKHALLGLMGSVHGEYNERLRVGMVCPWFADTPIVSTGFKLFMAGIPLTPISRIGGAIFKAATDSDPETNGAVYTLPDHGEIFRLNRAQLSLNEGVYKLLNDRARYVLDVVPRVRSFAAILRDVVRILGRKIILFAMVIIIGTVAWKSAPAIRGYLDKI